MSVTIGPMCPAAAHAVVRSSCVRPASITAAAIQSRASRACLAVKESGLVWMRLTRARAAKPAQSILQVGWYGPSRKQTSGSSRPFSRNSLIRAVHRGECLRCICMES
eukprot:3186040-Rhodomonas_salina.1